MTHYISTIELLLLNFKNYYNYLTLESLVVFYIGWVVHLVHLFRCTLWMGMPTVHTIVAGDISGKGDTREGVAKDLYHKVDNLTK